MFENPRRGRQARNFGKNVPKILDLKSSSEQIFSEGRWFSLLSLFLLRPLQLVYDTFAISFYLTWDQALFSFRFENYIPVGKAKRKDLIQSF